MDGEKELEQEKIIYKNIIKTRKTKHYIYIYKTDKTVVPFCTENVKEEDLKIILNYLSLCEE